MRKLLVGWLLVLLCPGCALLNESSAAKRADTYDVGTTVEVRAKDGVVRFSSTGDDQFTVKDAQIGDKKIAEMDFKFQRSPVLLAQGQRAKDITDLMGQQIALNEQWRLAWVQGLQELRGMVAELAPVISAIRASPGVKQTMPTPWGTATNERSPLPAPGPPGTTSQPSSDAVTPPKEAAQTASVSEPPSSPE
jgi:hypothetical protein